jgi:hypothetical protein
MTASTSCQWPSSCRDCGRETTRADQDLAVRQRGPSALRKLAQPIEGIVCLHGRGANRLKPKRRASAIGEYEGLASADPSHNLLCVGSQIAHGQLLGVRHGMKSRSKFGYALAPG